MTPDVPKAPETPPAPATPEAPNTPEPAPKAPEVSADTAKETPTKKAQDQLGRLAESVSAPLIGAITGLAGMLTTIRNQLKGLTPDIIDMMRNIPILKWFVPDPNAPSDGTQSSETIEQKLQIGISEIMKKNSKLGKKLQELFSNISKETDAAKKSTDMSDLEENATFIAAAYGVLDTKISLIPDSESDAKTQFMQRLEKLLEPFPVTKEEREKAQVALELLEKDLDYGVKIATKVPENMRAGFFTRLHKISSAHAAGKTDTVQAELALLDQDLAFVDRIAGLPDATKHAALYTALGAAIADREKNPQTSAFTELDEQIKKASLKIFEQQNKLSEAQAREEALRILRRMFGIYAGNIGPQDVQEVHEFKVNDFITEALWNNFGTSDDDKVEPLVNVLRSYITAHPDQPVLTADTAVLEYITKIVLDPVTLKKFKDLAREQGIQDPDAVAAQTTMTSTDTTQSSPTATATPAASAEAAPDGVQQEYKTKVNEALAPYAGKTTDLTTGQLSCNLPFLDGQNITTTQCTISGNNFTIGAHKYKMDLPHDANLESITLPGPAADGSAILTAGKFGFSQNKTVSLQDMLGYLATLRSGPQEHTVTVDGEKATFRKIG